MQAACGHIQGGWKVMSGCIQVVSPHFGKGFLGQGARRDGDSRQEVGSGPSLETSPGGVAGLTLLCGCCRVPGW